MRELDLQDIGEVVISGATGSDVHHHYMIDFTFPGSGIFLPYARVSNAKLESFDLDMLLGRDILGNAAFTYDGKTGIWELDLPRTGPPELPHISNDVAIVGGESARTKKSRNKAKQARKSRKKNRR